MKKQEIFFVDAFTKTPFKGNQAAVVILDKPADEKWMQQLANELNLAETAFLYKTGEGYNLRWFTPEVEVELCGHATLASTWVLYESGRIKDQEEVIFSTLSGNLHCTVNKTEIKMKFPAIFTEETIVQDTIKGLFPGLKTAELSKSGYLIVELSSENDVTSYTPDFNRLKQLGKYIIIATSKASMPGFDIVSRVFGPAFGINEDSVTGSAHCALATFWNKKTEQTKFSAFQASKRTGELGMELQGQSVILSGQAKTILKAEILV